MNNMQDYIEIKCLEVKQPIGLFYVGVIKWSDLLLITRKDLERVKREEEGVVGYFGIQRSLSKARLKEISEYVSFVDASFPSSIVISLDGLAYDKETDKFNKNIISFQNDTLRLRNDGKVAKIIDGQHRLFGLEKYILDNPLYKEQLEFDLIITVFIDIDEELESMIFSTINKAQTKVNKSLVYDLYELAKTRSPQRTAHNVVKLLDEETDSPLFEMINRLGKADDAERETITQATLVERILDYISNNPANDRNTLMKGKSLDLVKGKDLERRFFRNWFITNEEEKIAELVWNYFSAIKNRWGTAWTNQSILVKSTGVIAFMRFLLPIVKEFGTEKVISEDEFSTILKTINIEDTDFNKDKYIPGGVGISTLFNELKEKSGLN
ncbi:MAG TPA: DGQHR domain-containing protein [Pyrinomonadaceae bacterium]|nr:DGQHR domain-containing protein [Pyrinomonadaceae bacterium]